ncbi:MAG: hypothetical protein ACOYNZ_19580 [Rhodoferax sp.]
MNTGSTQELVRIPVDEVAIEGLLGLLDLLTAAEDVNDQTRPASTLRC